MQEYKSVHHFQNRSMLLSPQLKQLNNSFEFAFARTLCVPVSCGYAKNQYYLSREFWTYNSL